MSTPVSQVVVAVATPPPAPTYNKMYETLVQGPDDAIGAFAYVEYKRHKIAFIKDVTTKTGGSPTPEQMATFDIQAGTQHQIDSYKATGQKLAAAFLEAGLREKIAEIEQDARDSAVGASVTVVGNAVAAVQATLREKRTLRGWAAEVAGNVAVMFLSILLIGGLYGAYTYTSKAIAKTEETAGFHSDTADNAPQQSDKNLNRKQPATEVSPASR